MKRRFKIIVLLLGLTINLIQAQEISQNIRGRVLDMHTQQPLPGVTVFIPDSQPIQGTATDTDGYFTLNNVLVGRVNLQFSYIGYEPIYLNNISINSGKELVLNIEMEESVIRGEEIVIKANADKTESLNKLATISARTFSVEESQRYAGARNDVSRMATNYAGVSTANDATNDIVIRGNSPFGLLWRLDGVEIPNPNHFGFVGATGGPVSMLNNNVLSQSDFLTGAYPAEYGNSTSGVFDLKMRSGNYDKYEFLGQVGFNGFEVGLEGPLKIGKRSSFLANYRYSTLGLMAKMGMDFGTGTAVPYYQDLSFKVDVPTEHAGRFSLTGLAGKNHIHFLRSETDTSEIKDDFYGEDDLDVYNENSMGTIILNHVFPINEHTYTRTSLSINGMSNRADVDSIVLETREPIDFIGNKYIKYDIIAAFSLNKKFNARNFIKTGIQTNRMDYAFRDSIYSSSRDNWIPGLESKGSAWLFEAHISWNHKLSESLEFTSGLHYQHMGLNNRQILEPRLGMRWAFADQQSFNLGYGLHSMVNPLFLYFTRVETSPGIFVEPNRDLDFSKSHQFVAGYDRKFSGNLRLKVEAYFQHLYDAAIDGEEGSYSTINQSAMQFEVADYLESKGRGQNMGIELTVEKFLEKGFYMLFTASVFDSKYQSADGKWRSTAFDNDYVVNILAGKEFRILQNNKGKDRWLVIDGKVSMAGGQRYTPVDVARSLAQKQTYYQTEKAFSERFDNYFRADVRVAYRVDNSRFSQEWAFDIQNVTNKENPLYQSFNQKTGETQFIHQLGIMPMMQYRIVF